MLNLDPNPNLNPNPNPTHNLNLNANLDPNLYPEAQTSGKHGGCQNYNNVRCNNLIYYDPGYHRKDNHRDSHAVWDKMKHNHLLAD